MTSSLEQRRHLLSHARKQIPSEADWDDSINHMLRGWHRKGMPDIGVHLEKYTREDMLLDQLEQLPAEEQVHILIELLRMPELREIAEGIINDNIVACKAGDLLEVAKSINSWIATAEELVTSRRKMRFILAARHRRTSPKHEG